MQDKLNKIVQADCLEYLRELPDGCCEAVIFDEPYGILTGHKIEAGYNIDIAKQVRVEVMRVLKKDAWFVWFSAFPSAWEFGRITMEVGFKPWQACNEIVWCKRSMTSPFNKISRTHENIFIFQKGNPQIYENKAPASDIVYNNYRHGLQDEATLMSMIKAYEKVVKHARAGTYSNDIENITVQKLSNINDEFYSPAVKIQNTYYEKHGKYAECYRWAHERKIQSVWTFVPENRQSYNNKSGSKNGINIKHPTVKPILLLNRLIRLFTKESDTVLDPFVGSGTTALASIQTNRNFLACERDEGYVKIANDRLENWQEDLLRQKEWLEKRGVNDFFDDIEMPQTDKQETLI